MTDKPKPNLVEIPGNHKAYKIRGEDIVEIWVEKPSEALPPMIRIKFKEQTVNFGHSRGRGSDQIDDLELTKYELRDTMEQLLHWIRSELYRAAKNQLDIDLT